MVTAKRLYLYGVLAVVLLPLLVGLSGLLRLALDGLSEATGTQLLSGSSLAREEISFGIALVAVCGPLWGIHAWFVHRTVNGATDRAEERSSSVRATYVFLVLVVTLGVTSWSLFEAISTLGRTVLSGEHLRDMSHLVANVVVFGSAWLLHVGWRARDLRAAPERTSGDWLTRLYLYGALLSLGLLAVFAISETVTVLLREAAGLRPAYESSDWWREALVGPVATLAVLAPMWLVHWGMSVRLTRAPDPMGSDHRASRTRVGYLFGVVSLCVVTVLAMYASSLYNASAELTGAWKLSQGSRFLEDVAGPIVAGVPFVAAWWWHMRRAGKEGLVFGGSERHVSVTRLGRLAVGLVGLGGLAVGVTWGIESGLGVADYWFTHSVVSGSMLREGGLQGAALALIALVIWLPAWVLLQRERASDGPVVVRSTARRTYLLLVAGLSMVAVTGSTAWLLFQAIRTGLDAGQPQDVSWAIGILVVAAAILGYHLLVLRSDVALARVATAAQPADAQPGTAQVTPPQVLAPDVASRVVEALEISGPVGADFEALNAAIRSKLPDGYALRVLPRAAPDHR